MDQLEIKLIEDSEFPQIPFFEEHIQAGFPSPAQGLYGDSIDLNRELISNPSSSFCALVTGESMRDADIFPGDYLIIDRSLQPSNGDIAVCFIDGEFTVKRLSLRNGKLFLVPANDEYPEFEVSEDNNFIVWGIVTYVIHKKAR